MEQSLKFSVTPELAATLKTISAQNGVSAKSLAAAVGKSPSYISKLVNGDVKNIRKEDLTAILNALHNGESFYDVVLPNVFRVLASLVEADDILNQVWFMQYDTVDRQVEVTEELATDLRKRLEELDVSPERFVELINLNADSSDVPADCVNELKDLGCGTAHHITMRVGTTVEDMGRLLGEPGAKVSYSLVNMALFMLIKLELYGRGDYKMPPEESSQVLRELGLQMERYRINSLSDFSGLISSSRFFASRILSIREYSGMEASVASAVIDSFRDSFGYDSAGTTRQLEALTRNMQWDAAFTLKLIGLPFYKLDGVSFSRKKEILQEIEDLIDECDTLSDYEKRLESY